MDFRKRARQARLEVGGVLHFHECPALFHANGIDYGYARIQSIEADRIELVACDEPASEAIRRLDSGLLELIWERRILSYRFWFWVALSALGVVTILTKLGVLS